MKTRHRERLKVGRVIFYALVVPTQLRPIIVTNNERTLEAEEFRLARDENNNVIGSDRNHKVQELILHLKL